MAQLSEYVLRLTAAALICGLLLSLFGDGGLKELVRLICSVFLAITVFSPLKSLDIPDFEEYFTTFSADAQDISRQGTEMAHSARLEHISDTLTAYILDKAASLGMQLQITLSLTPDGCPEEILLTGEVPAKNRRQLSQWLTEQLGISKENQQWIG